MLTVRCRRIFSLPEPPRSGVLVVDKGKAVAILPDDTSAQVDLGNAAVIPPLVNSHTHLEFSDLPGPLGTRGNSLPAWIRDVVAHRHANASSDDLEVRRASTIRHGMKQSHDAMVRVVGDIVTPPWRPDSPVSLDQLDPFDSHETTTDVERTERNVAFWELLSLNLQRLPELMSAAQRHLQTCKPWRGGLSPHAPYSTHPELVSQACELSRQTKAPLAMHLAESLEEIELLQTGRGEFRTMLEDFGVWQEGVFDKPQRPIDILQQLSASFRSLVIHGNYLDAEERQFMADHDMTAVYCPRTHDYFEHAPYPLADFLRRGVRVALGTDSRASNPNLSVWDEFQFAAGQHPDVAPAELLNAVTVNGAAALGLAPIGIVGADVRDVPVVFLDGCSATDPFEQLCEATRIQPLSIRCGDQGP